MFEGDCNDIVCLIKTVLCMFSFIFFFFLFLQVIFLTVPVTVSGFACPCWFQWLWPILRLPRSWEKAQSVMTMAFPILIAAWPDKLFACFPCCFWRDTNVWHFLKKVPVCYFFFSFSFIVFMFFACIDFILFLMKALHLCRSFGIWLFCGGFNAFPFGCDLCVKSIFVCVCMCLCV